VIRPAGPQDVPFMRDMLRHAYYWRVSTVSETGEPPVRRYVERWGRPGDTALIAIQDFQPVGAAWYRLFREDHPGYGFVDEETPELSIAIVPSRRGGGLGSELLDALLVRARADGYDAISLSVEKGSPAVGLYERHGFDHVREDDGALTMRADLRAEQPEPAAPS
jgi:ribosomal protein S18 acetylase RimI-like enzyme